MLHIDSLRQFGWWSRRRYRVHLRSFRLINDTFRLRTTQPTLLTEAIITVLSIQNPGIPGAPKFNHVVLYHVSALRKPLPPFRLTQLGVRLAHSQTPVKVTSHLERHTSSVSHLSVSFEALCFYLDCPVTLLMAVSSATKRAIVDGTHVIELATGAVLILIYNTMSSGALYCLSSVSYVKSFTLRSSLIESARQLCITQFG